MFSTFFLDKIKTHPWFNLAPKSICLLPIPFIEQFADPTYEVSYGNLGLNDGRLYSAPTIWKNIISQGLYDPLYLSIMTHTTYGCDTGTYAKLESGYIRISQAKKYNLTHLPVVCFMRSYSSEEQFDESVFKTIIKKTDLDKFLIDKCNRPSSRYDPFPTPVDLKCIFPNEVIFHISDISEIKLENGIIYFK